jgi:distribution and morphology protein 34
VDDPCNQPRSDGPLTFAPPGAPSDLALPSLVRQPPTLALLEIGDLQADRFKGIFRLGYDGDARLVLGARVQVGPPRHASRSSNRSSRDLACKTGSLTLLDLSTSLSTQANPLNPSPSPLPSSTAPLAAHRPLLVPMALTLSNVRLRAIVVLIVSKHNGITIVFKNDPLESLDVSSTFDSISVLKGFIQKEIEGQLREMFREDLPGIIHTLSQQWFSSEASVEVERPTFPAQPQPSMTSHPSSAHLYAASGEGLPRTPESHPVASSSGHHDSAGTTPRGPRPSFSGSAAPAPTSPPSSSFPDIEDYDPTYGLRPEGLPTHTVISGSELGKIWERNRGFGEIFEDDFPEPGDGDEMGSGSAAMDRQQELDDDGRSSVYDPRDYYSQAGGSGVRGLFPALDRSRSSFTGAQSVASTPRTIHAVGGGTVLLRPGLASQPTTPRLTHHVHSSSLHHRGTSPAPLSAFNPRSRPVSRAQSCDLGRPSSAPGGQRYQTPPLSTSMSTSRSSASLATPASSAIGFGPAPPSLLSVSPQHNRTLSVSQGLPETISHLSQLSLSNHTLSQYTREHAHVAMRSHPPTAFRSNSAYGGNGGGGGLATPGGAGPRKAMRKRTHRLNTPAPTSTPASAPVSTSVSAFPSAPSSARSSPPYSRRSTGPFPPPAPVFAAAATPMRPKLESRASYGFPPVFEEASPFASRRGPDSLR